MSVFHDIPPVRRAARLMLFAALVLPFASACSDSPNETRLNELKRAEALWARTSGSANYVADQSRLCYCPDPQSASITVTNGQIVAGVDLRMSTTLRPDQFLLFRTVPQTFADIRTALALTGARVDVTYDPALGYPVRFSVDPGMRGDDDGYGYHTSSLVKVPN